MDIECCICARPNNPTTFFHTIKQKEGVEIYMCARCVKSRRNYCLLIDGAGYAGYVYVLSPIPLGEIFGY